MNFSTSRNFVLIFVLLCVLGFGSADSFLNLIGNVPDFVEGLAEEVPKIKSAIDELYNAPIQVIEGLPEQVVLGLGNELCSIYLASGRIDPLVTPEIDEMYFQLRTPCANISIPLNQAEKLLEESEFDTAKKVVVFVTGWGTNLNTPYIEDLAKAFHCRGGYNFLALNASNFIQTFYDWSAFNTEEIGRYLAKGLQNLMPTVPVENMYLIGHSLGAQIVGAAGRYFTTFTNQSLPRITGLDPANPCFNHGENLTGIFRGDAEFVDIIHTNPGVFGKKEPLGDVDFYAGGLAPIKPGCELLKSLSFFCSHERANLVYIESVYPENERNFLARRCTSLIHLNAGFCNGPEYPMGFAAPDFLKGNYFLGINAESPYGQDATSDAVVAPKECVPCESG